MKILLIGSNGQLGWELQRSCPAHVTLYSCDYPKIDLCDTDSVQKCLEANIPDCIINASGYTAVDKAETDHQVAERINHTAVAEIAEYCRQKHLFMVHISTDFIFNGMNYKPYQPNDSPGPISVYGKTKLNGETAVANILGRQSLIFRTAWLYSSHGANFVKTMLTLMKERKSLNIIDEQIGSPTWANGLAKAIWMSLEKRLSGIYHWTDAGVASWYDFAMAIQEEGIAAGLLDHAIPIFPIPACLYPTPAQRPFYSVLDKNQIWQALDIKPLHWRTQLRSMLKELHS